MGAVPDSGVGWLHVPLSLQYCCVPLNVTVLKPYVARPTMPGLMS